MRVDHLALAINKLINNHLERKFMVNAHHTQRYFPKDFITVEDLKDEETINELKALSEKLNKEKTSGRKTNTRTKRTTTK